MATTKEMFVYDMPYTVRTQLCLILDLYDKWEELGGKHMGFDYLYLQSIRKRKSPTDELLTEWGNQNHTVKELFILLFEMQHYRAMSVLKDYDKYQRILKETEAKLSLLSCDAAGLETSNFAKPQFKQNINCQPTNSKGFSHKVNNNANVYSNEANDEVTVNLQKNSPPEQKLQNKEKDVASYCRQIEFAELEAATNGWDSSFILGRGGFGTVFKGTWKNTTVAIKKLENQKDHQMQSSHVASNKLSSSMREVVYLTLHRHVNILDLFGCSFSENFTCLVYEYMANGSLEDCLHRKPQLTLDWAQRLNIMTGSARGLQFLHSQCDQPLVHGDIKSANILLDKNFEPRLGDFGLAREGPVPKYTHIKVSRVHGTKPYLPSEYLRNRQLSVKVDTYSFGVVLFEVATGQRAYNSERKDHYLKDYVENYQGNLFELADRKAGPSCCTAANLIALGKECVNDRSKNRPDMTRVLYDIETLYNNYRETEQTLYHQKLPSTRLMPAIHVEVASTSIPSPEPVISPFANAFSKVASSEIPRFSELGINSESEDKKDKVKVQSEEEQTRQEVSQRKSGLSSRRTNMSSEDLADDRTETSPNRIDSSFSVSLPILSQSANLPLLSDLLLKESVSVE